MRISKSILSCKNWDLVLLCIASSYLIVFVYWSCPCLLTRASCKAPNIYLQLPIVDITHNSYCYWFITRPLNTCNYLSLGSQQAPEASSLNRFRYIALTSWPWLTTATEAFGPNCYQLLPRASFKQSYKHNTYCYL